MAAEPRFLDTNVLLRLLTRDNDEKARAARALIRRVERGEERLLTSSLVLFEVVFTLGSFYRMPRQRIAEILQPLIELRGLEVPERRVFLRALALYAGSGVSFADAFSVATMEDRGVGEVYSWDTDFDRFPDITRLEPKAEEQPGPDHNM